MTEQEEEKEFRRRLEQKQEEMPSIDFEGLIDFDTDDEEMSEEEEEELIKRITELFTQKKGKRKQ